MIQVAPLIPMKTLVIATDLGRLKAYRVTQEMDEPSPKFEEICDEDFANRHSRYANRNTDQAGRFPSGLSGMTHGERHGEANQARLDQAKLVAEKIVELAGVEPGCDIFFAAPQAISAELLQHIDGSVAGRIRKQLALDLVKVPRLELWRRFEEA